MNPSNPSDDALLRKLELEAASTNYNILTESEWIRARTLFPISKRKLDLKNNVLPIANLRSPELSLHHKMRIALAPHKRLPTELLAKIFSFCADGHTVYFPPKFSVIPWVLKRVCSQWALLAGRERTLWSRVHIGPRVMNAEHLAFINKVLPSAGSLWIAVENQGFSDSIVQHLVIPNIKRIENLLLFVPPLPLYRIWALQPEAFSSIERLYIRLFHDIYEEVGLEISNFNILKHAPRLKEFSFPSHDRRDAPIILRLQLPWKQLTHLELCDLLGQGFTDICVTLQRCPLLQRLSIPMEHVPPPVTHDELRLPHLQSLRLVGGHNRNLLAIPLPWHQMTDLTFDHPSPPYTIGTILRRCPALQKLTFDVGWSDKYPPFNDGDVVSLPLLSTLILSTAAATKMLQFLRTPALVELCMRTGTYHPQGCQIPDIPREILGLCSRSECLLKKIEYHLPVFVHGTEGKPVGWPKVLETLPSITSFSAPHVPIEKAILMRIGSGDLVPCLQYFAALIEAPVAFADLVYARLASSNSHCALLREAHGYYPPRPPPPGLGSARNRLAAYNAEHGTLCTLTPRII